MADPLPQLWRDLLDEVTARGPLVRRTEEWLCLGWPRDKPEQTVQVSCMPAHGRMCLLLTADICPADVVKTRDALELAAKLLVGAPLIQKGILALRVVLVEGWFTRPQLYESIELLRDNALAYRRHLVPEKDAAALGLFKYVAD